jgi:hypothetical protein
MADVTSTIAESVPQLAYDVVGRLVPGTTVLLTLGVVYTGPRQLPAVFQALLQDPNLAKSVWLIFLLLLGAYVTSIVLHGLWHVGRSAVQRLRHAIRRLGKKPEQVQDNPYPSQGLMLDAIRLKSPESGARLIKLRAEHRLARSLILGWGLAAVWDLVLLIQRFSVERLWLLIALIAGVVAAWASKRYIAEIYALSLGHHWRILQFDQEPWYASSPDKKG